MSRSVAQSIAQRTASACNVRNVQVIVSNVPPPPNQGQGSKQSQLNCRAGLVLATPLTGQQVQGVQVPLIWKILLKACISRGNNKDSKTFTLRNINISELVLPFEPCPWLGGGGYIAHNHLNITNVTGPLSYALSNRSRHLELALGQVHVFSTSGSKSVSKYIYRACADNSLTTDLKIPVYRI